MNNLFSANITVSRVVAILQLPLAPCITRHHRASLPAFSSAQLAIDIVSCTTPNRSLRVPFALQLQRGCSAIVCGRVGCGKSTLLHIIAGECDIATSSCISVFGRVLFVPQEPQLFKGSIKDNICLGQDCDEARLHRAIYDVCLAEDLGTFEFGLQTDVGSKGCSLSGGQRARVSLARVLYHVADNDVLVLDDVFAALDEQTFKQIVKRMFSASSIPESVAVVLTCARGLSFPRPLCSICVCDGTVSLQSTPQTTVDDSNTASCLPSLPLSSLHSPVSCRTEADSTTLKSLLEQLQRDSQLPEHSLAQNCGSSSAAEASRQLIPGSEKSTQLVDWSNLAV